MRDQILEEGRRKEVKAVWPPIINAATFDRVQEILKGNRWRKKPLGDKIHPYILTGLIRCKTCGDPMCGVSSTRQVQEIRLLYPRLGKQKGSNHYRPHS